MVSAGGTQEDIDPVRYISNRSSGKMGYSIARAAALEDADVTLVSCTHALPEPVGVHMIYVHDARNWKRQLMPSMTIVMHLSWLQLYLIIVQPCGPKIK